MKKNRIIYPALLMLSILLFNHCNKHKCHQVVGPDDTVFSFRLVDENTKETLIAAWGTKYDHEEIEFKHEFEDTIRNLNIRSDGRISFYLLDDINVNNLDDFLNKKYSNTYHIFLPNKDTEYDIDTIMINFELNTVDDILCKPYWYQNLEILFNDSLYHKGEFLTEIDFLKEN